MTEADRLLEHIESVVGATADSFRRLDVHLERGRVNCCVFENRPRAGVRTLVTFGLSHTHPSGGDEHVELMLEVGSQNELWTFAVAECAAQAHRLAFREGDLFTVGEAFVPEESQLCGFAIVAPLAIPFERHRVDTRPGSPRVVALRQLIPLFPGEFAHAQKIGGAAAVAEYRRHFSFEPWNVRRADCSAQ